MAHSNKRGVSPLIATVLLIAFAVALGAVVMNWGRSYVQDTMTSVQQKSDLERQCSSDVSIEIQEIAGRPQICYGGGGVDGYVKFMVTNKGTINIDGLRIEIIGISDIQSNASLNGTSMAISATKRKNVSYDYTVFGEIQLIKITPLVTIAGRNTSCSGRAIQRSFTDLRNCS